jgi:hypothetical protein
MKKIILAISFIVMSLLTLCAQETHPNNKPLYGPKIVFTEEIHLFGDIARHSDGNCEFIFTNEGNEPLILSNVTTSCGCTSPSWSKEPVMPGHKGSIKVHYDTGRIGDFNKTITVKSNAVNSPSLVLKIRGSVK